jgi:SAM-dependent methyltransferase
MVHGAAAEGFDREPATYQRGRPSYHPDLIARFVERYGRGAVLEVGAGTGIFTQQIVEHGVHVVAVEPVAGMRERLIDAVPNVDVREGTAEALPVEAASFDTVVVAQSFHWFDYELALDEIHRALHQGGHLVTVWNVKDGSAEWFKGYMEIVDRHAGDTPRHADMRWRAAIDADRRYDLVDDWRRDHPRLMDTDAVLARAMSTSFIAALPDEDREAVATDLTRVLETVEAPLEFPYRAELQAWRTEV